MNENLLESVDEQSSHLPSVIQTNEVSLLPNLTERSWSGAPIPFKGNILNPKFECPAGLINLSTDITISAADRFSLLGGINGFLHMMKRHSLTPDIRIFTQVTQGINSIAKCSINYFSFWI